MSTSVQGALLLPRMMRGDISGDASTRCQQTIYQTSHKKNETEKAKAPKDPKEQHVSLVRSGRGKGYMRLGTQEENVPNVFKKNVVPKKTRSLTVAENIFEELIVVELAKSISIEEQRHQQRKIMTQLTIDKQIEKDVEDIDATQDSSRSYTDEAKDDETDDYDDSDMDLSDDEPKGDDDVSLLNEPPINELTDFVSNQVYTDAHTTSVMANLEGVTEEMLPDEATHHKSSQPVNTIHYPIKNHLQNSLQAKAKKLIQKAKKNMRKINFKKVVSQKFKEYDQKLVALTSINVFEVIEKGVHEKVIKEMKKLLPTHVLKSVANYVNPRLNNSVHKDRPNDCEGENKKKRRKDAGEPSSKLSRKDKWFTKKSGSENDKRRTTWFGPSIVAIAKKLKELIQKDELTIAYLEGAGLEKLKKQEKYTTSLTKNYAASYHIQSIKDMIPDRWSKEVDIPRLNLNDIEDMYLLKVQDKLHDLQSKFEKDFNNTHLLFIRTTVIRNKVEDLQLEVESYQQTLNLTKPKLYFEGIKDKIPYIMSRIEKGVVHLNQHNHRSLMKLNEVRKFCDGTLMKIRENLIDMVNKNELGRGTTSTNLTAKLPILNPGDYDLWLMRIEQYFLMTDYSLWEVIKNGNKVLKVLKRKIREVETEYEPTTVEEKQDRRNEMKARGTL
ncbi:hypothetical protein Tco_1530574 [Tanacetum coccineum]